MIIISFRNCRHDTTPVFLQFNSLDCIGSAELSWVNKQKKHSKLQRRRTFRLMLAHKSTKCTPPCSLVLLLWWQKYARFASIQPVPSCPLSTLPLPKETWSLPPVPRQQFCCPLMTWAFNYTTICLLDTPVSKVWVCLKCDVQISPPVGMITTYVIGDNYMMGYLQSKNVNWFLCLQIHGWFWGSHASTAEGAAVKIFTLFFLWALSSSCPKTNLWLRLIMKDGNAAQICM